jgi:hypothetical protein
LSRSMSADAGVARAHRRSHTTTFIIRRRPGELAVR